MTSNEINTSLIISRGRRAVRIALLYTFDRIFGSTPYSAELLKTLDALLESQAAQRWIDDLLLRILPNSPELVRLLSRPNGLELTAGLLCEFADQTILSQLSGSDLAQARAIVAQMYEQFQETLKGFEGDGLSALGDELEVDFDTLAREPERLRKIFPPRGIGLGAAEISKLEEALGFSISDRGGDGRTDEYVQAMFPFLLQIAYAPHELGRGSPAANSPLWEWVGVKKPSNHHHISQEQAINLVVTGLTNFFSRMAEQNNRQEMLRYFIARHLRQEYDLGVGRGYESIKFSGFEEKREAQDIWGNDLPPWDPPDPASIQAFEKAESLMMLESIYNAAPPAQREALELHYEAEKTGRFLADLCRERGKDPNLVRNNFQALKNSVRKKASRT
jgi:hypothetical protein